MSKRDYNVFFNTHTVSGIIISIGLYVIFFAGAFALFMDNINQWESNEKTQDVLILDYDRALATASAEGYNMHGRSITIYRPEGNILVRSGAVTDSTLNKSDLALLSNSVASGRFTLQLDKESYLSTASKKAAKHNSLGSFIYELHFFEQIPTIGGYLAGFISIFFLFASITGIIIHWKKIGSNFFTFRLKASLKNLWTDSHTALGVIGLPFQIMYAVTGAIFCLLVVFTVPFSEFVYGGDTKSLRKDMYPPFQDGHIPVEGYLHDDISINDLVARALTDFPEGQVKSIYLTVLNYHDQNAHVEFFVGTHRNDALFNYAKYVYRISDGKLMEYLTTEETPPYAAAVWELIHIIHFGNYGGILIKVLYFILALLTCFVIISGVMIWLVARDKKTYADKTRFNQNVGAIYLGSSLGLYPAIALMFLLTKTFPLEMEHRFAWISWIFLAFWIGYTVYSFVIKSSFKINRHALLLGGAMGILIPVFNGFHSGLWFWKSLGMGYTDSFFVDISWLICGMITLSVALKIKPLKSKKPV